MSKKWRIPPAAAVHSADNRRIPPPSAASPNASPGSRRGGGGARRQPLGPGPGPALRRPVHILAKRSRGSATPPSTPPSPGTAASAKRPSSSARCSSPRAAASSSAISPSAASALKLPVRVPTFLRRYPTLLAVSAPPEPVASPSPHLLAFPDFASRLYELHAPLLASRLAKLIMISSTRALPVTKIDAPKRDFGIPDDFLVSLVPRYPGLFRLVGDPGPDASGNAFLELVAWDDRLAKSMIEGQADKEADVVGIRPRPNFTVKLPKGFYLKKKMREWVRDWLELPYISSYADASGLHPASPEAEKREANHWRFT
ncbi:unnamed protein product [Miscanthus lutarioriparius]|uniref:PORR domain-containing protein n=1 Tax=Miscanthus lutarioriparius TaxID=422564 RepID=A0A811QSF6_9POAL|nr:unnamed protein product [Miscanthus lutarioriparius]